MLYKLCDDVNNLILSFLIDRGNQTLLSIDRRYFLTNDIFFLQLTSKYWNNLITNYIDENYKNIRVRFSNRIEYAAVKGHVNVLEWFKNSGKLYETELKNNKEVIACASQNGRVNVLEWFKNSDYKFTYDKWAITYASSKGYVNILEWFKNNGYKIIYDDIAINQAVVGGHIDVLDWFKNNDYEIKYNRYIINRTVAYPHIINWFNKNGYLL